MPASIVRASSRRPLPSCNRARLIVVRSSGSRTDAASHGEGVTEVDFSQFQVPLLKMYFAAHTECLGTVYGFFGIKVECLFNRFERIANGACAMLRGCQGRHIHGYANAIPDLDQCIYPLTISGDIVGCPVELRSRDDQEDIAELPPHLGNLCFSQSFESFARQSFYRFVSLSRSESLAAEISVHGRSWGVVGLTTVLILAVARAATSARPSMTFKLAEPKIR